MAAEVCSSTFQSAGQRGSRTPLSHAEGQPHRGVAAPGRPQEPLWSLPGISCDTPQSSPFEDDSLDSLTQGVVDASRTAGGEESSGGESFTLQDSSDAGLRRNTAMLSSCNKGGASKLHRLPKVMSSSCLLRYSLSGCREEGEEWETLEGASVGRGGAAAATGLALQQLRRAQEDVEMRILTQRLRLLESQRAYAAMRCQQFTQMLEASLSPRLSSCEELEEPSMALSRVRSLSLSPSIAPGSLSLSPSTGPVLEHSPSKRRTQRRRVRSRNSWHCASFG